ncbi:hypothetical protein DIPPA_20395 [Diplonema papillatum]|nr:hypothetical protein DIPPA_20395 [Diplonema papillatum]
MVPTGAPDTPAPGTVPPDTDVPVNSTAANTAAPDTATPATDHPSPRPSDAPFFASGAPTKATPAPATPAPPAPDTPAPQPALHTFAPVSTAAPEKAVAPQPPGGTWVSHTPVQESSETMQKASAVFAAGVLVGSSAHSAGHSTRLMLVASGCYVYDDQDFPFSLHPTQISFGGSAPLSMLAGNLALTAGFCAACYVFLLFVRPLGGHLLPSVFAGLDLQGALRLPSAPVLLFTFTFQGTALACFILLYSPPSAFHFCIALFSLLGVCAVPLLLFAEVRRSIPAAGYYRLDSVRRSKLYEVAVGRGEWVARVKSLHWVNRYTTVVRTYGQEAAWYCFVEYCTTLALAAMSGAKTESYVGCAWVKLFSGVLLLVQLAVEARVWPHVRVRDTYTDFALIALETVASFFMAVGFFLQDPDHVFHVLASFCVSAAFAVLSLKVCLDILCEVLVLLTGRRDRLQHETWRENEEGPVANLLSGWKTGDTELDLFGEADDQKSTTSGALSSASIPDDLTSTALLPLSLLKSPCAAPVPLLIRAPSSFLSDDACDSTLSKGMLLSPVSSYKSHRSLAADTCPALGRTSPASVKRLPLACKRNASVSGAFPPAWIAPASPLTPVRLNVSTRSLSSSYGRSPPARRKIRSFSSIE